ncbi:MAG: hypothetical protein KF901_19470, partial [Myxococcales bacterium]|nr:hypothetical protein [Myxococcales bacterium]
MLPLPASRATSSDPVSATAPVSGTAPVSDTAPVSGTASATAPVSATAPDVPRPAQHRRPRRATFATRALCTFLASLTVLTVGTPLAARAQDPDGAYESSDAPRLREELRDALPDDLRYPVSEEVRAQLGARDRESLRDVLTSDGEGPEATETELPENVSPTSLPTGEAKSAVEPTRISLPSAEGSIEGMGESFAPVLSSGTATFSVPLALPAGRAGVQPSLGLSYASTNGNGAVGIGWSLSTPFIVRQSDRGLPRYVDGPAWTPDEDRFFYNGGQELAPVDTAAMAAVDGSGGLYPNVSGVPSEVSGWQQYRARVEGGFLRFFRSPDARRWVVQGKDGTRFDFGLLPSGEGPSDLDANVALQSELPSGGGRVYGWHLTRMSDAHGSTVYYRYLRHGGEVYVQDVYYLSPASCAGGSPAAQRACSAPLDAYGARVHFDYELRGDVTSRYASGWRVETAYRLRRVTMTAAEAEGRALVRRYHLAYVPSARSFHSLLASVQVEGRPATSQGAGTFAHETFTHVTESAALGDALDRRRGQLLPPMSFGYTEPPAGPIPGFGGVDSTVRAVEGPPEVSVDAARADLFDVNSDGLPDLIVTDPARYRTADGRPAVGVFFNGFTGPSARPAGRAGVFSEAIAMPMRGDLSGTLNLGNANIVPMDVDGDGRSDLLHMPRLDRYGFFTPTRASDAATGQSASPADQGWRFTYAEVALERGTDPRVDFVRDGTHYQVFDVNGDHLIDVVRTTGTVMQTWLNLGWLEGGEGRFGQARRVGDGYALSTAPHETCLLHDGLPLDFADPELRLADMNGDGLTDLVKIRRGRVVWWPGRGTTATGAPVFGDGPAECGRGQGAGRQRVMDNPPRELNPELSNVFLADVNGDGAPDVVQVRFREVDVYFNRAGEGFTDRVIVPAPFAPDFAPRIRLTDIDGTATTDLVYASSRRWEYLDFMGGQRPRLLTRVENGLGATTTLTYSTSAVDYTLDLAQAASGGGGGGNAGADETFTWSRADGDCDGLLRDLSGECAYRSGGSPVVSTVVRSVSTSDHFDRLGRAANVTTTRFAYHDGYYEGIEQEFRGFGAADAVAEGDAHHPTAYTRTYFHQGRRPQSIATDRLADNPYEALKGRQWLTEVFAPDGLFQSSAHATIALRRLGVGLDGRGLWYAYVSQADELRYDTAGVPGAPLATSLAGPAGELSLPSVVHQEVSAGGVVSEVGSESTTITVRAAGHAHLRSTTESVDNLGHVREQTAHGRPGVDEAITAHVRPTLLGDGRGWLWRTEGEWATGAASGGTRFGWTASRFDEVTGDLTWSAQLAEYGGPAYAFGGDADGAQAYTLGAAYGETNAAFGGASGQVLEASTTYDGWGNALASCAGADLEAASAGACWRYAEIRYDDEYAQLPEAEAIAVQGDTSAGFCEPGVLCMMSTSAVWDRGFGALLSATDPNGQSTSVRYDGLGRLSAVVPPRHSGDVAQNSFCPEGSPTQTFEYHLVPGGLPVSYVEARSHWQYRCSTVPNNSLMTRSYVDGLGRERASLVRTEVGGSDRLWVKSGIAELSRRGTPYLAYDPVYTLTGEPTPAAAVGVPSSPAVRVFYDAFGQEIRGVERDQSETRVFHLALETVAADALDLGAVGGGHTGWNDIATFLGTYTRTRVDGHGRPIDQVLHQRDPDTLDDSFERLYSSYRADGAVLSVTRAETSTPAPGATPTAGRALTRSFVYDTLGRRIGGTDPDSDGRSGGEETRRWRYLYNRVGDLVAMRDPRGCGQNFYYDRAGRLLAEDYVGCAEAQRAGDDPDETLPSEAIGLGLDTAAGTREVDVRYYFDALPAWASTFGSRPSSLDRGRLVGGSDRGQRSLVAYDTRGRAVWSARQMAIVPAAGDAPFVRTGDAPAPYEDDHPASGGTRLYDEAHTYVSTSTYDRIDRPVGKTWPTDPDWALFGGTGSAPAVSGTLNYNTRGLPVSAWVTINDGAPYTQQILRNVSYDAFGAAINTYFGASSIGVRRTDAYDVRRRPTRLQWIHNPGTSAHIMDLRYGWDAANNLATVSDDLASMYRDQHPEAQRPRRMQIEHDALYRVTSVDFAYRPMSGANTWTTTGHPATDWRETQAAHRSVDPMRRTPAPRVGELPEGRVINLSYRYDWLANQTEWTDDAGAFYERSLGANIRNGFTEGQTNGGELRPTALYLASNLPTSAPSPDVDIDRGGFVRVRYGESGNATAVTVRGQCHDVSAVTSCYDDAAQSDVETRAAHLVSRCRCDVEQHYEYRWDELNRLAEARRYDRAGSGDWALQVRQRYRYDAGNIRTLKETVDQQTAGSGGEATGGVERVALYVMPGDFERRGLTTDRVSGTYVASLGLGTETQYVVAGARVVWKPGASGSSATGFERDARITMALPDLLQSTSAVVDLMRGELLEVGTFYPSGARETLRANAEVEAF